MTHRTLIAVTMFGIGLVAAGTASAQCPEQGPIQNWTGAGATACPCFVPNEQAGSVFTVPAAELPIEILRVGIGWGSQFGGAPDSLENAIQIYEGGLPNPGPPTFVLPGPQLTDGVINEFDLEPIPGEIVINQPTFSVTLEFLNQNAGDIFAPSVVHDGNGCQPGKNLVFAIPGGWNDACVLGVSGDWVFHVVYRSLACSVDPAGAVPDGNAVPGAQLAVSKLLNNLLLTWDFSCSATDTDYEIYEGAVGMWYSHFPKLCTTGGATAAVVNPSGNSSYYLVVPTNGSGEGSYGRDGFGAERPKGDASCVPQELGACP